MRTPHLHLQSPTGALESSSFIEITNALTGGTGNLFNGSAKGQPLKFKLKSPKSADGTQPIIAERSSSVRSRQSFSNPARDAKIRHSVRSSGPLVHPFRDVLEPASPELLKSTGAFIMLMSKRSRKNMSIKDVTNMINTPQVEEAESSMKGSVLCKELIGMLKGIYGKNKEAFRGKAVKNWAGKDKIFSICKD